ncbi:MAG: hypothetical protein O7A04_04425, partial [Acidobacteria bacterium]|nr:hypothetical protein [Acidobacteriota bacterium]
MSVRSAPDPAGRDLAANTLVAAFAAIVPCWWLGVEQVVPGMIILLGAWRVWSLGELRRPAELWPLALLGVWSLASMAALEGRADWLIYVRGESHLVVGLCAYALASSVRPASAGFERFLQSSLAFVAVVLVVGVLVMAGVLPFQLRSAISLGWPDFTTGSTFLDDFVLRRQLGTAAGVSLLPGFDRQSSFFLYQGGLATVLLMLQGWMLVARHRLTGAWRHAATA